MSKETLTVVSDVLKL